MIRPRRILSLCAGHAPVDLWLQEAASPPVAQLTRRATCPHCPMRRGGEWREGLDAAVATMTPEQRQEVLAVGCHASPHRCAGVADSVGCAP